MVSRAALRQCDGADLYKASRSRRGRFLFRLPGNLSPLAGGGRLGTLENMASGEPIMYIEFPEGRLKLRGKLTYPRNRYLSLSIDAKAKKLMCNDAFDVVVRCRTTHTQCPRPPCTQHYAQCPHSPYTEYRGRFAESAPRVRAA